MHPKKNLGMLRDPVTLCPKQAAQCNLGYAGETIDGRLSAIGSMLAEFMFILCRRRTTVFVMYFNRGSGGYL